MFDPRLRRRTPERDAPLLLQNWEADISDVIVERCDRNEDPLGYQVVFCASEKMRAVAINNFVIGASHLVQRLASLKKAGYDAPMTQKAIAMLEKRLGTEYFHA